MDPRRIGFLRTAGIGDTVLMAACTKTVKDVWPGARLFVVAGANGPVAELLPGVDEVIQIDARRPLAALTSLRRRGPFDILVDFGQWPRVDALLSALSGARFRVGFQTAGQYRHFAYDLTAEHRDDRHEADNFSALLECVGLSVHGRPELSAPDGPVAPRRVVVHMFSGGSEGRRKEWPQEHWIAVIRGLLDRGYQVVLTGTGAEEVTAKAVAASFNEQVQSLAGRLELRELVEMVARSALTISVDTGVAHIASALGVPLVGLYGPTSPDRWGPLGDNGIAVVGDSDCVGCISLGFERACTETDCMRSIPPERVLEAALLHLGPSPGS